MSSLKDRPTEKQTLQYDLSDFSPSDDYTLHYCMESFPLQRHDEASLRRAREEHAFLRYVPDTNLTHYIEADLPSDAVALKQVTKPVTIGGVTTEQTVSLSIHVPRKGR